MDWSNILAFTFVATLLVISPGPNGVLIAKTVPTSGRNAGLTNVAGFLAAFYLHGALAILGLSIILVQSAVAFTIVKYLGAAYLCWIGIKALMSAYSGVEIQRTLLKAFGEGFLTNALNPIAVRACLSWCRNGRIPSRNLLVAFDHESEARMRQALE